MIRYIRENKTDLMELFLIGDEQESMVMKYLDRGDVIAFEENDKILGVCVVTDEGDGVLELKNISVRPECQRMGIGRCLIEFIEQHYDGSFSVLTAGTGDSPLTVPFYEKCGFVRSHAVRDFFTENYDHPIIEGGVLLRDMVYFKKRFGGSYD